MSDDEPTVKDIADWCRAQAKKGADAVHARAAGMDARKPQLTNAESAAIARAKIDKGKP